jgi:hypothetical protein
MPHEPQGTQKKAQKDVVIFLSYTFIPYLKQILNVGKQVLELMYEGTQQNFFKFGKWLLQPKTPQKNSEIGQQFVYGNFHHLVIYSQKNIIQ